MRYIIYIYVSFPIFFYEVNYITQIGTWNTWNGLDIKDIVWPGQSHVPPQGVPEKFHMKITFLEEPPFIILSEPDPISGKCSMNHGVHCWIDSR